MKLCIFCSRFYLDTGCPDWSEITAGDSAEISCSAGHWQMGNSEGADIYRKHIKRARACPDYERVEA